MKLILSTKGSNRLIVPMENPIRQKTNEKIWAFFLSKFENKYENTKSNIEYENIKTDKIIFWKIWPGFNNEINAIAEMVIVIITTRKITSLVWNSFSSRASFSFPSDFLFRKKATNITTSNAVGIARSKFAMESKYLNSDLFVYFLYLLFIVTFFYLGLS